MSKKAPNRLAKSFKIASAKIHFHATGERYIHPTLRLLTADNETIVAIKFQVHRLDMDEYHSAPGSGGIPWTDASIKPDTRWDFGPWPYSACYAPKFEEGRAYSFGSLKAEISHNVGADLRTLARLMDLVDRTVHDYNLRYLAPRCELTLWFYALEKLGVYIEVTRGIGQGNAWRKLEQYSWRHDLPENQREPAADFLAKQKGNGSDGKE